MRHLLRKNSKYTEGQVSRLQAGLSRPYALLQAKRLLLLEEQPNSMRVDEKVGVSPRELIFSLLHNSTHAGELCFWGACDNHRVGDPARLARFLLAQTARIDQADFVELSACLNRIILIATVQCKAALHGKCLLPSSTEAFAAKRSGEASTLLSAHGAPR